MKRLPTFTACLRAFRSALIVTSMLLSVLTGMAGTWTQLQNAAPGNVQLMLLLPDATVMAADSDVANKCYKLTPTNGSYINGKWTTLSPMASSRLYFSSVVLRDGRVFVAGAEYSKDNGKTTAEIYSPLSNNWISVAVPTNILDWTTNGNQAFVDSDAMILPDGRVMIAPVVPQNSFDTLIYDPVNNSWSGGPTVRAGNQNEASWVKLPDDSILSIDSGSTNSERYLPDSYLAGHIPPIATNRWITDSNLPVALYGNPGSEIGPAMLLNNGTAFFVGGNGNTAIYTPSGDNTKGSWQTGPMIPNVIQYALDDNGNEIQGAAFLTSGATPDAPAANMVNGRILYAFSGQLYNDPREGTLSGDATNNFWLNTTNTLYPAPTTFFVYDPPTKTFTQIAGPNGTTDDIPTYKAAMLVLPDGSVLYTHQGTDLYVYSLDPIHNVDDRIDPSSRPTIQSIRQNLDGSWHLTGTQLNGLSQGATYGDDLQMDENYPLVRLTAASGEVTYARSFNWSSTGVQTGTNVVSTDFVLPPVIAGTGTVSVVVVANGITSDSATLPLVRPGETLTFSGNASMGANGYEIQGGITIFQDDGTASGILLRGDGGTILLLDSAGAGTATVNVDGGMGNGGIPAFLEFKNNSTAAAATIENRPGALGPNFKNAVPKPTTGLGGETRFFDFALAGTAHINNAAAAFGSGYDNGITSFAGNASADHAVFANNGVSAVTSAFAYGGETEFEGVATADHGTFTNLNSNNSSQFSQGRTVFFETTTAGQGMFVNVGGNGGFLELGGTTEFRGSSTAANGTFINQGGTGGSYPGRGATQFFETASAGTGMFLNKPAAGGGGGTEFYGHASAANGTFINDSRNSSDSQGGFVMFTDDATAGHGQFTNMGYPGGGISFLLRSSADNSTIVLEPNVNTSASRLEFHNTSTASNSIINIGANGCVMQFYDGSTAGNAAITISGNAGFNNNSTAGNAAITVSGSSVTGGNGSLGFVAPATAGQATITAGGASVTGNGTSGGIVSFDYGSSAGTATLIANGGTNGGSGGRILFGRGGSGTQARVTIHPGGSLEVGGNVLFGGTPIGSIEGDGSVFLGQALMTVGSLNSDTTFAGVIGSTPNGGTVTKVGTGSLALSGTNTYTGLTTVAGGTLAVNGSLTGPVQVNGGATLKGSGSIGGTVTVLPGGIVAPGNSPGTLTIGGDYLQEPQGMLEMEVAGPNPQNQDHLMVNSNINLSGKLLLAFSGYAPSATDSFTLLQAGGSLNVSNLEIVVFGLKPGYQPTYQVSAGKLILTATSSGQLRTVEDPAQTLNPWFTLHSGFVYAVFTVAGATYQFDTSTDLKTWTPIHQVPGANVLVEFRNIPSSADSYRFYRIVQINGSP